MGSHSNPEIEKHIDSTQDLVQKMNELKHSLSQNVLAQFQEDMGVPFPSIVEADVRIFDFSLVYSTDPKIDEYVTGAKGVLDAGLAADFPAVANKALDLVSVVAHGLIGSGGVGIGVKSDSAKIFDKDRTFISACYSLVEECSSRDWATAEDFYIANYMFVVWEPPAHVESVIMTARIEEV